MLARIQTICHENVSPVTWKIREEDCNVTSRQVMESIVLVVQWCYWLFSHGLKFYSIYCSLKWMPDHAKEYPFDVIEVILPARKWKLLWRIWISQDVNGSLKTLLNVYNYADILAECAFRAIECRLVHMNVFSHYCLTFSANDCVFSLIEIQNVKVNQNIGVLFWFLSCGNLSISV